ncbi:molybdate ABC transporter substrate-binding protein [Ammonicoccus fulvus]|uniref:Molybdate ABC transporter substrate-binding protein n=1 Tax=Ammonicoccus fulvus TaxID=3138240 RepID=A0ABZ3FNR4_9ACTN
MTRVVLALVALALALTACGQSGPASPGVSPRSETSPTSSGPTIVFAAASLNKAFPEAAGDHEVSFSFDGSSGLVDQLVGGAPADVFASADKRNMDKAVTAGVIDGDAMMFATNYLVLVVPAGNPAGVTGFDASLDKAKLVVCAPEVPCGGATQRVADKAGLALKPVSEESSVTDVLGKVTSGEADAGIVYATDAAQAADRVEVLDIAGAKDDPNTYWIAKVKNAPDSAGADAFIDRILSASGQDSLSTFGFGPPQ